MFYILTQEGDSMIFKVFEAQCKNRTTKDWIATVLDDMKSLDLNVTFCLKFDYSVLLIGGMTYLLMSCTF